MTTCGLNRWFVWLVTHFVPILVNTISRRLVTDLPKVEIKRRIRRALGSRILGFISALGQNLKRQPAFAGALLLGMQSVTEQGQTALTVYTADDDTSADQVSYDDNPDDDDSSSNGYDDPSDDGFGDDDSEPNDTDNQLTGIIYARVSDEDQVDDADDSETEGKGSITGQIEELKTVAEKNDIELPFDPITDKGETGRNFDRDGIKRVFELARRERVDLLLVEKVDRIGRTAPENLYFIDLLQSKCDVTFATPSGRHDISNIQGLMHTTLMSLMAEVQNKIRTNKATKERIRSFLKKKNWSARSPKVPLGYTETTDGWLEPDPSEQEIVRRMFSIFTEHETYAEVEREITQEYGSDVLKGHKVKTLLQNSIYIGEPRLPEEWLVDTEYENEVEEPELHLLRADADSDVAVSEDDFHKAQEIIADKNSSGTADDDVYELADFIEEYGLFPVVEGTKLARLVHHCGEPMVRDGQFTIGGSSDITTHRYKCPKCETEEDPSDYYRQWPKTHELNNMDLLDKLVRGDLPSFIEDDE